MLRRLTAATLLPLVPLATACTAMATVQSPTEFISTKTPPIVWVTKTDNTVVPITQPQVRGDSLAGLADGQDPITLPLSSVQSMRARQPAHGKTRLLVIGSIVVAAGMATTLVGVGRAQGDTLCHPETGKTCGT